jgi:hypothetical protein
VPPCETYLLQANTAQLAAACAALKAQREARAANLEPKRPGEATEVTYDGYPEAMT